MQESKAYEPKVLILLGALFLAVMFSSCAPTPGYSSPRQTKRCIAFVGATYCQPCNAIKREVFPKLEANGLKIGKYTDGNPADVHTLDADEDAKIVKSWKLDSVLPAIVVFEGQTIVQTVYGSQSEHDFYRLLGRDDLLNHDPPAELVKDDESRSTIDTHGEPVPVKDSQKTTWDQLTEFIGCDTAVLTLTIPKGRKVVIDEANAAAHVPETLTARVKVVGESIQIDFDKPHVFAEGKKFGIRISTNIPNVTLTRDKVRVATGLGIPFTWKLENHPFGTFDRDPEEALDEEPTK